MYIVNDVDRRGRGRLPQEPLPCSVCPFANNGALLWHDRRMAHFLGEWWSHFCQRGGLTVAP